ncbi:MAG: hypothetical protein EZS28_027469, partial [Streblomastix strix]
NKMAALLQRHVQRELKKKSEFEYMKMELWAKVVDCFLEFQEKEEFPRELRLIERAELKKIIKSYFEYWCNRSTYVQMKKTMEMYESNVDEHTEEINALPDDERERGIDNLIDIYITEGTIEKTEELLQEYPYKTPEEQKREKEEIEAKKRKQEEEAELLKKQGKTAPQIVQSQMSADKEKASIVAEKAMDTDTAKEIGVVLENEENGKKLADIIKKTAIAKGWEVARDVIFKEMEQSINAHILLLDPNEDHFVVPIQESQI